MTTVATALRDSYVKFLEEENERLRGRIENLEAELGGGFAAPVAWRLTPSEACVFGVLLKKPLASKSAIMTALYRGLAQDEADEKIVDVFVCKLRRKLRPFGIQIETVWGRGFALAAASRAALAGKGAAAAA